MSIAGRGMPYSPSKAKLLPSSAGRQLSYKVRRVSSPRVSGLLGGTQSELAKVYL